MSRADPIRKVLADLPCAEKAQPTSADGITEPEVAKANIGKCSEVRDHLEVDPESRVKEANVNFVPVQDKPVTPFGCLPELKEDNDPAVGQVFSAYQLVEHPHQEVRIKVFVTQIAA